LTNRELHNLELYYAGCRNAKRDLEKFGEKCCLKVIDTFTSEELKEISFEKGYLDGFNDYRKGETTMENKLTANEKKLLKAYAISLANAASNYERLGYGTEREKEFFDNYIETKSVLFEFINSL
jgi:hypothetical protein